MPFVRLFEWGFIWDAKFISLTKATKEWLMGARIFEKPTGTLFPISFRKEALLLAQRDARSSGKGRDA